MILLPDTEKNFFFPTVREQLLFWLPILSEMGKRDSELVPLGLKNLKPYMSKWVNKMK